ncbi:hypothetical protein D3C86_2172020 [compost metagenome]
MPAAPFAPTSPVIATDTDAPRARAAEGVKVMVFASDDSAHVPATVVPSAFTTP